MSKPHSDLSLLKFNYRKTKKEIIEEELFDLCTWFPITPNFRKHKINSYKLYGKNLFYGVKRKDLRKILLNKLIFNKQSYSGLFYNSIVSIQPMSKPSGLIFYLDYVNNIESIVDESIMD